MKIHIDIPDKLIESVVERQHKLRITTRAEAIRLALVQWSGCQGDVIKRGKRTGNRPKAIKKPKVDSPEPIVVEQPIQKIPSNWRI